MVPYIVLFVCLLFGGFFEVCRPTNMNDLEETKEKYKNFYAIIPGLIIFFLGVFRETSVGADAQSYYIYYWNRLEGFTWNELFTNFSIASFSNYISPLYFIYYFVFFHILTKVNIK